MSVLVRHHATCTADYPEKCPDEGPGQINRMVLEEISKVCYFCVDCGAQVLVKLSEDTGC